MKKTPKRKTDVREGNRNNLEKLTVEYQPQLKSFIRKRVDNREDAEDILQDVFYQLAKTLNTTMNPIEHVAAWLYRVARNMIINHGIKKREEEMPVYRSDENEDEIMTDISETLFCNESSPSPEMEYLRSLMWKELETALAELPPDQREIYELTELDGIPMKVISATTGIPVNTLLSRKHYAVLHLRKRMKQSYYDILSG
ncbi:MAG: sigma-70 family RNA polymerase sigma factor [Prevotellaceae bacterium]|jgi:RNA polymerase sigma factor (sigma-70 family)|nr:sigma-70 family RNA polymerase sigma factor [Prevotellaceae bacterium]